MITIDLKSVPKESGVYFMKENETYLYIGKSINLRDRLSSHPRIRQFVDKKVDITFELFPIKEINEVEKEYISKYNPIFNNTTIEEERKSIKISNESWEKLRKESFERRITMKELLDNLIKEI